jgi:hypothetical protein
MVTINCPVCGWRGATTGDSGPPSLCPACGAALVAPDGSRDDSATRPVPLDQLPTRPGPMESGETRDLPASALPSAPGTATATKATKAPGKMWRGLSIAALVALLLALAAGAALAVNGGLPPGQQGASPTATASAPTTTPATVTYKRPSLYSIAYPTGWGALEQNNPPYRYSASFINPSGGASVTVTVQQTQAYIDAATVDDQYLSGLTVKTGATPQHVSKPQPVSLAGQIWTEMSADVSLLTSAGIQYTHAVVVTVNYHGYLYTIVRLVPWPDKAGAGSAFAVAERASFQPMLATFTFLG